MSQHRLFLLIGCLAAAMAMAAPAFATPVSTVKQEIANFANRFGDPVIVRGALNMDAPVSFSFSTGLDSDQAITALAQAAGANAIRVYFVSPAEGSNLTLGSGAERLVGDRGNVSLDLHKVAARSAIESVAGLDDAEVKFPDGVPSGTVTVSLTSVPLSTAVARIALLTHTRWTLGYVLESTNPGLPTLSQQKASGELANSNVKGGSSLGPDVPADWPTSAVITNLPPMKPLARDASGNILPFTIHVPVQPKEPTAPVITASMTPAEIAAARQEYAEEEQQYAIAQAQQQQFQSQFGMINSQNQPQSAIAPSFQAIPGNNMFGGPNGANQNYLGGNYGAVQTIIPTGNQSGFSLSPIYGLGY